MINKIDIKIKSYQILRYKIDKKLKKNSKQNLYINKKN